MDQSADFFQDGIDIRPVSIIGNLNVDLIIRNVPRMPLWGQEVYGKNYMLVSSGQVGYLAFALRGLEIPTAVIGNVGQDIFGDQILSDLHRYEVDIDGVDITPGGRSGITVAMVRQDGERAFVSEQGCLVDYFEKDVLAHWNKVEPAGIVCLVGTFMLANLDFSACARLLEKASRSGKVTMLDTGWDPNDWPDETKSGMREMLKHVRLYLPNLDEARALTSKQKLEEAAMALQELGPELVVVKCGADGSYARFGAETYQVPALPVDVYDAVGAGDVFNAGFMFGLRQGWPIRACLAFGNSASSLYISRSLDRFPKLAEVDAVARSSYPYVPNID
jgi:ribokinase